MTNATQLAAALAALGDPTRRHLFEAVAQRASAVNELARDLPVSRSAVSQHLRVLKDAGLVMDEAAGTRRIYRIDPRGIGALRDWLDAHWATGARRIQGLRRHGNGRGELIVTIAPVVCTVETNASPDRAFTLFTARIGEWWPGRTIGRNPHVAIVIEPHPGGRWFERAADGEETHWGKVLVWGPARAAGAGLAARQPVPLRPSDPDRGRDQLRPGPGWRHGGFGLSIATSNATALSPAGSRSPITGGWAEKLAGFAHAADRRGMAA